MFEKRFAAVPAQVFTADGGANGSVSIADTRLFKVKQQVVITATGQTNLELEIKKVLSATLMIVGPIAGSINTFTNLSAYTTAANAEIFANEQKRPTIDSDSWERAVYEEEPTVAKRVVLVDDLGNKYNDDNPLPTSATFSGSISVGEVDQGAPNTNANAWPVKITGSDSAGVESNYLAIDSSGRITVNQGAAGAANWLINLTQVGGSALALGQTTMASSIPVTLASNQSPLDVTQSGTWTTARSWTLASGTDSVAAVQSGTWTVAQGAAAVLSGYWPVRVTDGTNTMPTMDTASRSGYHRVTDGTNTAAVKAASTAAAVTDPAMVVAISPNNTVAATQSGTWTVQPGNTANSTAWRVEGQKTHNSAAPSSNNLGVLPAVANTAVPTYTEGNQVALSTDLSGTLRVTSSTVGSEEATYTVIASAIAPGNNKSMLAIYNPTGSGYVLKLREYYIRNAATSAVTGVVGNFELHRFVMASAPTGGTNLTTNIASHDSNDSTPASMRASTGDTISGEVAASLDLIRMSTDDWGPGTADVESYQQAIANYLPARAKRDGLLRPFIMHAGEGIHIKFATNSTAGRIDVVFVFTKV